MNTLDIPNIKNRMRIALASGWTLKTEMVDVGFIVSVDEPRIGWLSPDGIWYEGNHRVPHYWEDRNAIIDALSRQPIEFQQKVMHRLMEKRFSASYATIHCRVQMSFRHMAQLMTCDVALIADSFLECL